MVKTGIFVGKNHGHVVTRKEVNPKKARPARRLRKIGKRTKLIRDVIR